MISNYIIIYLKRINKFLKTKNLFIIEFEESLNLAEFCEKKLIKMIVYLSFYALFTMKVH